MREYFLFDFTRKIIERGRSVLVRRQPGMWFEFEFEFDLTQRFLAARLDQIYFEQVIKV
jgi:hypothetical protein